MASDMSASGLSDNASPVWVMRSATSDTASRGPSGGPSRSFSSARGTQSKHCPSRTLATHYQLSHGHNSMLPGSAAASLYSHVHQGGYESDSGVVERKSLCSQCCQPINKDHPDGMLTYITVLLSPVLLYYYHLYYYITILLSPVLLYYCITITCITILLSPVLLYYYHLYYYITITCITMLLYYCITILLSPVLLLTSLVVRGSQISLNSTSSKPIFALMYRFTLICYLSVATHFLLFKYILFSFTLQADERNSADVSIYSV